MAKKPYADREAGIFLLSCRFSENVVEVVTFLDAGSYLQFGESAGWAYLFRSAFTISAGTAQPTTIGAIHSGIVATMLRQSGRAPSF
jgi:hypothetical protein